MVNDDSVYVGTHKGCGGDMFFYPPGDESLFAPAWRCDKCREMVFDEKDLATCVEPPMTLVWVRDALTGMHYASLVPVNKAKGMERVLCVKP